MELVNKRNLAYAISLLGLMLFLAFVGMVNSVKADMSVHGKVVGIQDNFVIIEINAMDEPPLFQGQQIELWIPDTGNNPDPVVTPTAIPLCGADC